MRRLFLLLLFLSAMGWAACPGGSVSIAPGVNIQGVVNANPAGTTYCLLVGTHRQQAVTPKAGDTFVGETGVAAILNGSKVLSVWTVEGSIWYANPGEAPKVDAGWACLGDSPRCKYQQDLFYDGAWLKHVDSKAGVGAGKWFFQDSTHVYIGDNPAGHTVELSSTENAFTAGVSSVTIDGLTVEKYANASQGGAIHANGGSWTVKNCEIRNNHGGGVYMGPSGLTKDNNIHHNGQIGILIQAGTGVGVGDQRAGPGGTVDGNEISYNNMAGYRYDWEAGSAKFLNTKNLLVRNNYSHDNRGVGLWTDYGNYYTVYESNRVSKDKEVGIMHELSFDATIRYNVVENQQQSEFYQNQLWNNVSIAAAQSRRVEAHHNTVLNNINGIAGLNDARPSNSDYPEGFAVSDLNVHDNVVVQTMNWAAGIEQNALADTNPFDPSQNNRWQSNIYKLDNNAATRYRWQGDLTKAQWQAIPQDSLGVWKDPADASWPSTKFTEGQQIKALVLLNVYTLPSTVDGNLVGTENAGVLGTVTKVRGPIYNENSWWWQVKWGDNKMGWSVEANLGLAAITHPRVVFTPTLLTAVKQRARDNTAEWQALKGSVGASLTCDWATQTTAGTPDGMPPVYASREPTTAYGTPTGYLRTGTDGAYYQGSEAWVAMTNLAVCWITLKDGDVDVAGSTPGTGDEVALAAKYGSQAVKVFNKFTAPYARVIPTTPPARWENRTWRPIWYITNDGPATGCGSGTQLRAYLYYHNFVGGESIAFSGVLGLDSLNSGTYKAASGGITSLSFLLESTTGTPICDTAGATNYNHNPLGDDGYPIRFFVAGVATIYDWMFDHASMTAALRSQAVDHIDAFIGEAKNYDNSLRDVQYETNTMTNYHWGPYSALAVAGAAIDDARADVWYDDWRNSMHLMRDQPFADRWMKNNTGFFEAWRYSGLGLMQLAFALEAARTGKSDDLINHPQSFPFVLDMMRWFKHDLQPSGTRALDRGYVGPPSSNGQLPFEANRLSVGSWWILQHLADVHNHPLKDKFRKFLADSFTTMSGLTGYPSVTGWSVAGPEFMRFMFWNPSGTQTAWDDEATRLPTMSNPAGGYGAIYMRQDWTSGGVLGAFTTHSYISDMGNNKERVDAGSLFLQRGNTYLTVNPLAECIRGMPAVPGASPEYTAAANCYNAILEQGANPSYLGSAYNNVFYLHKPGQAEGPLSSMRQDGGSQKLGTYNPWSPGRDKYPDAMQSGVPYKKARTYAVDSGTDTFTSTGHGFSNGDPALFTSGSGLAEGAVPGGLTRGTRYFIRDAAADTFKVAATSGGIALDITDAGTGTQYVYSGKGPSNTTRMVTTTHPTRIDRYESGTGYVYARGIGLHYVYQYDPVYTTHYPYENWQREVIYLSPKLFVVHDKTQKTPKSAGTTKTITGATNATPIQITTSTDHGYHTGMTVTVADVTGNVAANGSWTISVNSKTTFTLDGSVGSGDYVSGGTASGTVFYRQFLAWMTGKTPTAVTPPTGATRYHVQDGATFKGAITTLLPVDNVGSAVNFGNYGLLYQVRAMPPTNTDTTQWLTVLDVADSAGGVTTTTRLTSANVNAVQLGSNAVVGFVPGDSPVFPMNYTHSGSTATQHTLAGFPPSTVFKVTMNTNEIIVSDVGGGTSYTSSAAGLLRFTSYVTNTMLFSSGKAASFGRVVLK